MKVDPGARLTWPVYPFNPYRNAPEADLRHAVGALTVPIRVKPPVASTLPWRTQEISFTLEANDRKASGGTPIPEKPDWAGHPENTWVKRSPREGAPAPAAEKEAAPAKAAKPAEEPQGTLATDEALAALKEKLAGGKS